MTPHNRSDGAETRRRLLDAAVAAFAAEGYHGAKTAAICRRAKANGAAVNYYFGGKESLYVEAWRHAFLRSIAAHPPDGGVAADAPAGERLGGVVRALLARMFDPASLEFEIVHKEMANPTGLLAEIMRRSIGPLRERMKGLVLELLGPGASEAQAQLCGMSIYGQCFFLLLQRRGPHCAGDARAGQPPPPPAPLDEVAAHIVRFSLAGLRACRTPPRSSKQARHSR